MQHAAFRKNPPLESSHSVLSGGFAVALLQAPAALFDRLSAWQHQAEERAHLLSLTDHQLRDMGLTRDAVEDMARKPFWTR